MTSKNWTAGRPGPVRPSVALTVTRAKARLNARDRERSGLERGERRDIGTGDRRTGGVRDGVALRVHERADKQDAVGLADADRDVGEI